MVAAAALAVPVRPPPPVEAARPRDTIVRLQSAACVADPSGALYWPEERLLVVADLHLEKGSCYATRRLFLPPYDTAATLARLMAVVARFAPRRVVALGDSFHDQAGARRLLARDIQALRALQIGRDWLWIAGNHDPAPTGLDGDHATELSVDGIMLRHEPTASPRGGEIAGHLHPVALVGGRGGAVRRRCFVATATRCIMPAFGAYAGGLNIRDAAFSCLHDPTESAVLAHVLGRDAVYTVALRQCLAEGGRGSALRRA